MNKPKYQGALICGHSDGWFATVSDCWPGEFRIRLWLALYLREGMCNRQLRRHEFIPNRRPAKPKPLPKPQVKPETLTAVSEILQMDSAAEA